MCVSDAAGCLGSVALLSADHAAFELFRKNGARRCSNADKFTPFQFEN